MLDYAHLEALLAVVREKSFDGAGKSLGISASAISQRIKLLEQRAGAIVVDRQNPIKPTEVGKALCKHAEMVFLAEQKVLKSYVRNHNQARVNISIFVCEESHSNWLTEVMANYLQTDDGLVLEIVTADSKDHYVEIPIGSALAAVLNRKKPMQGFRSTFLGSSLYRAVASPDFIGQYFATGVNLYTLRKAPSLRHHSLDKIHMEWIEQVCGENVPHDSHVIPSSLTGMNACVLGLGWSVSPAFVVDNFIKQGKLVELCPGQNLVKPLYWHCSHMVAKQLEGFTRTLLKTTKSVLATI